MPPPASASARRVFIVVNKQDTVSPEEREQALQHVREQASAALGEDTTKVFPFSAREGLVAKRDNDSARLAASGIEALEAELVRFLLDEKSSEFLLRLCDRVMDLVYGLAPDADTRQLLEHIDALSRRIAESRPGATPRHDAAAGAASDASQRFQPCAICAHIADAEFEFLSHFQYELCIRPEVQHRHAEHSGFCAFHTWQYGALASTQGICIGYPALLEHLSDTFDRLAATKLSPQTLSSAWQALSPGRETCVLCQVRARAETEAVLSIATRIAQEKEAALHALSVICLPHLRKLIGAVGDADTIRLLLAREAALLDRLAEDMRRYATKYDAVRRILTSDEEDRAAHRALLALAGLRNVNQAPIAD